MSEGDFTLVVAPAPDDETLGACGLIARAVKRPMDVVLITDGAASHPGSIASPRQRLAPVRLAEMRTAVTMLRLGAGRLYLLCLRVEAVSRNGAAARRAMSRMTRHTGECRAKIIRDTRRHDPQSDHPAALRMCKAAVARLSARLLAYLIWNLLLSPDQRIFAQRGRSFRLDVRAARSGTLARTNAHQIETGTLTDIADGFTLRNTLLQKARSRHKAYVQCT